MKKALLTYIFLAILCLFSSGCAASMKSSKVGISPSIPVNAVSIENNLIPQDNNIILSNEADLTSFIVNYNSRLDRDEAHFIANIILKTSNNYKVSYKVITALVAIESGFKPTAKSPSGALGLGQLMPSTARHLKVYNPLDPSDNLNGTAKLLRAHLEKYNGNINYALAAYKMGSGTVSRYGISQPATVQYIKNIRKVFDRIP